MSMVQFVEQARSAGMVKLNERIKNAMERLQYLMESYLFEQGETALVQQVLVGIESVLV